MLISTTVWAGDSATQQDDVSVESNEATAGQNVYTADDETVALLELAEEMLANPDDFSGQDWADLSASLDKTIPEVAKRKQDLNRDLNTARKEGRSDQAVSKLMEEKEILERKISETIENLPSVVRVQESMKAEHNHLMDTMKMRTKVQHHIRTSTQEKVSQNAAAAQ